jgi:Uma2 family endonuclease
MTMSIASHPTTERLVAELYRVEGKAEIVDGRIFMMSPTGDEPGDAAGSIYVSLRQYAKNFGGKAYGDNVGFLVDLPNRNSFCPDASYYVGPRTGMKFLSEAPIFAVEVRSENDYGSTAERDMADKRADYFAAGTKVVWDVDLLSGDVIRKYTAESPAVPTIYHRGEIADADPALSGWKFSVDELFD